MKIRTITLLIILSIIAVIILWLLVYNRIIFGGDTIVGLTNRGRTISKGYYNDYISVWSGRNYLPRLAGQDPKKYKDDNIPINRNTNDRLNYVRIEDLLLYYCCKKLQQNIVVNDINYNPDDYFRLRHQLEREEYITCCHDFDEYKTIINSNNINYGLKITYIDTKSGMSSSKRPNSFVEDVKGILTNINSYITNSNINYETNIVNFLYPTLTKDILFSCLTHQGNYYRGNTNAVYKYDLTNVNGIITIYGKMCSDGDGMFWNDNQTQLHCIEIDEHENYCTYIPNTNSEYTVENAIYKYKVENSESNITQNLTTLIKSYNGHLVKSIINMFTVQSKIGNGRKICVYVNNIHVCDIVKV